MKSALIAAIVSVVVASGSTYAATTISGLAIARHSIPANRLTSKAVKAFTAPRAQSPRALAAAVNSTLDYEQTTTDITDTPQTASAFCPAGDVAIGGGYTVDNVGSGSGSGAIENSTTPDHTGWQVVGSFVLLNNGAPGTITVYVSCEPSA
jgi:hypothetical protein